jgi:hypothetical protein
MSQENVEAVKRPDEALTHGDVEAVLEAFAELRVDHPEIPDLGDAIVAIGRLSPHQHMDHARTRACRTRVAMPAAGQAGRASASVVEHLRLLALELLVREHVLFVKLAKLPQLIQLFIADAGCLSGLGRLSWLARCSLLRSGRLLLPCRLRVPVFLGGDGRSADHRGASSALAPVS